MAFDPKEGAEYVKELIDRFEKAPDSLSEFEKSLTGKYLTARSEAEKAGEAIAQVRRQIQQAESRVLEIERDRNQALGKAAGILEILFSEKSKKEEGNVVPMPTTKKKTSRRRKKR
jgi:hypothetical protein